MKRVLILSFFLFHFHAESAQELKFEGLLSIKENEQLQATYKLKETSEGRYDLAIHPLGATSSCVYLVKKISAPQQTRGMKGIVFSNRSKTCQFKMENKVAENFWNSIVLIDFNYYLTKEATLAGRASAKSLEKEYPANLKFE